MVSIRAIFSYRIPFVSRGKGTEFLNLVEMLLEHQLPSPIYVCDVVLVLNKIIALAIFLCIELPLQYFHVH
jgi:hypothetical protein